MSGEIHIFVAVQDMGCSMRDHCGCPFGGCALSRQQRGECVLPVRICTTTYAMLRCL
jgi:hypothetical protein